MKRLIAITGMMLLLTTPTVMAQQPAPPADPHHPQSQAQPPAPPAGQPAPNPGAAMGGMMPMMQMCPMMGPGMVGGAQAADPKTMSQMMEMRGEMMKAMGDVMLKHAKRMQGMPSPTK